MARDIIKYHTAFLDGLHLGSVKSYTPPVLTVTTEDYRAGAMDAGEPIDMGMEPLEAEVTMGAIEVDVHKAAGRMADSTLKIRGAIQRVDGTTVAIIHELTGRVVVGDRGEWAAGSMPEPKATVKAHYFKETIDGVVITEIDIRNMKRIVDGVDQLAEVRSALGL